MATRSIKDLDAVVPLDFEASIDIEKSTNGQDADLPPIPFILVGDPVTWTVRGHQYRQCLSRRYQVVDDNGTPDDDDDFSPTYVSGDGGIIGVLEPGETWIYSFGPEPRRTGPLSKLRDRHGRPVYGDGTTDVEGVEAPTDTDPSAYFGIPELGRLVSYTMNKTVTDVDGEGAAGVAEDAGDVITYSIVVFNDGDLPIPGLVLSDPLLQGAQRHAERSGPDRRRRHPTTCSTSAKPGPIPAPTRCSRPTSTARARSSPSTSRAASSTTLRS